MKHHSQSRLCADPVAASLAAAQRILRVLVLLLVAIVPGSCGGGEPNENIAHPRFPGCGTDDDTAALTPVFECLSLTPSGNAYAVWGYSNSGPPVAAVLGPTNIFEPDPSGRGQPVFFEHGNHHAVFATPLAATDKTLVWTLGGGTARVRALATSAMCPPSLTGAGLVVTIASSSLVLEPDVEREFAGVLADTTTEEPRSGDLPRTTTVGTLEGSFEAAADGAATYSIPLAVPQGRAGMQPNISLTYNSYAGNGPLGVGWSVSGFSQITRCNKTFGSPTTSRGFGVDGIAEEIHFDLRDRLCLDGDYLIGTRDSNGDIREYRPEHAPFDKVVVDSFDGLGPTTFTILRRDGRIQRYGVGSRNRLEGLRRGWSIDAKEAITKQAAMLVRFSWLLSETADRAGNAMWFEYADPDSTCAAGFPFACTSYELLPTAIHYTSRASDAAATAGGVDRPSRRSVRFFYNGDPRPRPDQAETYISGFALRQSHLLTRIEMWAPNPSEGGLVRYYELAFQGDRPDLGTSGSITGRSLLQSITECDPKRTCKHPTRLHYEPGDISFTDVDTGITGPVDNPSSLHWALVTGDFNGDGRDDILYPRFSRETQVGFYENKWYYRLSTGTGFGPEIETALKQTYNPHLRPPTPFAVDIDGDGAAEIAFPITWGGDPGPPAYWTYLKFTPAGFAPYPSTTEAVEQSGCYQFACTQATGLYAADLDGDGLPEFLRQRVTDKKFPPPTGGPGFYLWSHWAIRKNAAGLLHASWGIMSDTSGTANYFDVQGGWNAYAADVAGAGRSSLLFQELIDPDFKRLRKRFSSATTAETGPAGTVIVQPTTLEAANESDSSFRYVFTDINGDGASDAIRIPNKSGFPLISVNTARGFPEPSEAVAPGPLKTPAWSFPPVTTDPLAPPVDGGLRVMDVDLDGHPDLVLMGVNGPARVSEGLFNSIFWYRSRFAGGLHGLQFGGHLVSGGPGTSATIPAHSFGDTALFLSQILDVNGDGLSDMAQIVDGPAPRHLHLYIRSGHKPDQLTGVIDGYGAATSIGYAPVVKTRSDCKFPTYCVSRGVWAVSEWELTPGKKSGPGTRHFSVEYEAPSFDAHGRGFLVLL
jgi:hypothetical protein